MISGFLGIHIERFFCFYTIENQNNESKGWLRYEFYGTIVKQEKGRCAYCAKDAESGAEGSNRGVYGPRYVCAGDPAGGGLPDQHRFQGRGALPSGAPRARHGFPGRVPARHRVVESVFQI